MFFELFDAQLIASGIRLSTPLIFAALGGLLSERSGVVNIALDGIMIFGAFFAAVVAYETANPWYGFLMAMVTGGMIAHIHSIACIRYCANQIVSGTAINILALGVPAVLAGFLYNSTSVTPSIERLIPEIDIPFIQDIPIINQIFSGHSVFVYLAFILVFVVWFILFKTPFGLRIRVVGENPEAAESTGIDVYLVRYYAVFLSGVMAGLGGAFLSISHGSSYVRNISAGRGFIALAALIFGRYHPKTTLVGCLIFGFADALQIRMQSTIQIPVQFVHMFPYLLTILILAGFIGRSYVPKSIGIPYEKNR